MKACISLCMIALALLASADDRVDMIVKSMKQIIDNVPSIPPARAEIYKNGIDKARPCIETLSKDMTPERINIAGSKVLPISIECGKLIQAEQDVEKRKQDFEKCLRSRIREASVGLDEVQQNNLIKVQECVKDALKQ